MKVTAHGTCVVLPQQQPAAKQPSRPMAWPRTTPGASTSAVCQPGQAVTARVPPGDEDPADEAAVEDAPALEDGEELPRVAAEVAPVHGDEQQLRPDEAGDQHPDRHVGDAVRVEPGPLRLPGGDPEAGQEGDGEQDAVGVEGEGPDRAPRAARTRGWSRGGGACQSILPAVGAAASIPGLASAGEGPGERRMSRTSSVTPTVMAESATLKSGHWWCRQYTWTKSTT